MKEKIIIDEEQFKQANFLSSTPAFRKLVSHALKKEGEILEGKMFAEICGHPKWKNACHCCGEVEIPIGSTNCKACELGRLLKASQR